MKMLIFDFRESERDFFDKNSLTDFDITFIKKPLNEFTELTETQYNDTDIISVFTTSNVSENILRKFKNLRIVSTRSRAYDHIDLNYCTNHNIAVFNIEQYGKTAVAEYAAALILSLVRNLLPAYFDMRKHLINHKNYEGRILSSYTLGIIGCGAIGSAVAKIAVFFGMKVLIHSYMKNSELTDSCEFVTLDELLENSDIITLHLPYNGENYHMISEEQFDKMKNGVYIVNTARGELLDIKALYDNLVKGKVLGAALDVLECEFISTYKGEMAAVMEESGQHCVETALITQKLFDMKNVIITPHIAYNTKESIDYILNETFNLIRDYIKGVNTNRVC